MQAVGHHLGSSDTWISEARAGPPGSIVSHPSQAIVEQFHLALRVQHHIFSHQVQIDYIHLVQIGESLQNLFGNDQQLLLPLHKLLLKVGQVSRPTLLNHNDSLVLASLNI